jgi:nucleoside-diphosphate-sugar epimerase
MSRVLVTGGTGFLGTHLSATLARTGWEVVAADIHPPVDVIDYDFLELDVRDAAAVRKAVAGCDVVVNNAALVPVTRSSYETYAAVNLGGTENVLAAAKKEGAYVAHISSTSLYGVPPKVPIQPDTPFTPFEPYGRSKLAAERAVERERAAGMIVSSLRPRTLLGPGRLGIFDVIFPRIQHGKTVPLFGRGDNQEQLLHVDDMCAAVLRAIELRSNGSYNVGATEFGTVREDFEALLAHAGTGARLVGIPVPLLHGILRPLDLINQSPFTSWHYMTAHVPFYIDVSETMRELGWAPQRSNTQMLIDTYEWFLQRGEVRGESAHHRPLSGVLARALRG